MWETYRDKSSMINKMTFGSLSSRQVLIYESESGDVLIHRFTEAVIKVAGNYNTVFTFVISIALSGTGAASVLE